MRVHQDRSFLAAVKNMLMFQARANSQGPKCRSFVFHAKRKTESDWSFQGRDGRRQTSTYPGLKNISFPSKWMPARTLRTQRKRESSLNITIQDGRSFSCHSNFEGSNGKIGQNKNKHQQQWQQQHQEQQNVKNNNNKNNSCEAKCNLLSIQKEPILKNQTRRTRLQHQAQRKIYKQEKRTVQNHKNIAVFIAKHKSRPPLSLSSSL